MRALADAIKTCLLDANISVDVKIRQKRRELHKELHILLESDYFGEQITNQELVIEFLNSLFQHNEELLRGFNLQPYVLVRAYGFLCGQALPQWVEVIPLPHASNSHIQATTAGSELNLAQGSKVISTQSNISDRFIVCGLGSLGQHAVFNLHKFAYGEYSVKVCAIDRVRPDITEFDNFSELLEQDIIIGDCRRTDVLIQAGIHDCRTVLLVTDDENVNIEAAIAVRRLNPSSHIVVRSSRHNLNQLLKEQLGSFVALDPVDLPAAAFAVAGIGEGTLGLFQIGDHKLRVVEYPLTDANQRFVGSAAHTLHKKNLRLLSIATPPNPHLFFQWQPERILEIGDKIAFIELLDRDTFSFHQSDTLPENKSVPNHPSQWHSISQTISLWTTLWTKLDFWLKQWHKAKAWIIAERSRQLVCWGIIIAIALAIATVCILVNNVSTISMPKAISISMILLLGGFGDVFGGLGEDQVPFWVLMYCLSVTLVSLLFLLGIVGLVADQILTSKFEFFKRTLPLPTRDHIVLIGFGRLGQRIADLLFRLKMPMIIISANPYSGDLATEIPWVTGNIIQELPKANLSMAKSIISVTDDQMLNLEAALLARSADRTQQEQIQLVIRTYDRYFSENIADLLPSSQSFCAYALSAEAFAGAAFGENMLSLFRLNQRTVLVAEYKITADDTLFGKNLSQIAYGYTVVPIYLKKHEPKANGVSEFLMPSDDEVMAEGDRLILLASISGLRRIELGSLHPPQSWQVYAEPPLNSSVLLDAGNRLRNISGCDLELARRFMEQLPAVIELPMYHTQAYRLSQALNRLLPVKVYPI